jgi:protein phosphatase
VDIRIPSVALVLLVGPAGAGKTTFARAHFRPTEVLSSDFFRGLVSDSEADQSATEAAFEALRLVARLRLSRRRLTVVDAVSARPPDRRELLQIAEDQHCSAVAIVLDLPPDVCIERDRARQGRRVGEAVIREQSLDVRRSLEQLPGEGLSEVFVLNSEAAVASVRVRRAPLPVNRRWDRGPFDIVGDVHGCIEELHELVAELGYVIDPDGTPAVHQGGRRLVFAGDLAGPGPDPEAALQLAGRLRERDLALMVRGDLDPAGTGAPSHYVLDRGALVVAHAGLPSVMQGRDAPSVTRFAVFGEGADGWADEYRGRAQVVHGHFPVLEPRWYRRTLDIHTGCVTGGRLTAMRYPELELVWVNARRAYV